MPMAATSKVAHILIVDDEPLILSGLSQYLKQQGYEVATAQSVKEALSEIERRMPDMVLLDLCMPDINGLELLAEMRQDPDTQTVPVIVTSGLTGTDDIVGALRAGANDYVTKPIDLAVLLARVERHLALADAIANLERQSQMQWQMSQTDDLTGICNRRFLFQSLDSEIYRSQRHGIPLSLMLIDLDHFRRVNQEFGAGAGDGVLRQFVESISGALRRSDKLCRYEGEEFCVILPQTDQRGAIKAAEDVRQWIEQISFTVDEKDVTMTVSIGINALTPDHKGGAAQLVDDAMRALEEARRNGPNRICVFEKEGIKMLEGSGTAA